MCFAPYISMTTFTIEFLLALYFFLSNPKDKLNRIIALISLLLGFYQLNEFLICVTNSVVFTKLAIIITSILPAIAITFVLIAARKKIKLYWHLLIYVPAIFFITMFATLYYKISAACHTIFIQYPGAGLMGDFYGLYYFVYIVGAGILFYLFSQKAKNKQERIIMHFGALGMVIFTVPTAIFLIFLPMFVNQFPSVLCEFALLLAIELVVLLWYKNKHKLKY